MKLQHKNRDLRAPAPEFLLPKNSLRAAISNARAINIAFILENITNFEVNDTPDAATMEIFMYGSFEI